jgi:protein-S-isoprenylcysteine O-methyltransferase Ste14
MYLGDVLIFLGIAEVTKSVWFVAAAAAFGVLVTILQIIPEERRLESQFGDTYLDYKARSRRWI